MKNLSKTLLSVALVTFTGITAFAQDKNTGVIDYEINARMPQRGGAEGDGEERVVTFNQHFYFAAGKGKLETDRPDFGGQRFGRDRQRGPAGRNGGQRGNRFSRTPGAFGGGSYVDLAGKKYLQLFAKPGDSTKTYYAEEAYTAAKDAKLADKTKKIAGFNCKKATVKLHNEEYTVWYTQDLPFSYSPINGLLPDGNGVVLSAESSRRSFTATNVAFKPVTTNVSIPANAEKVTEDQLRDLRREAMQKFRQRPNAN